MLGRDDWSAGTSNAGQLADSFGWGTYYHCRRGLLQHHRPTITTQPPAPQWRMVRARQASSMPAVRWPSTALYALCALSMYPIMDRAPHSLLLLAIECSDSCSRARCMPPASFSMQQPHKPRNNDDITADATERRGRHSIGVVRPPAPAAFRSRRCALSPSSSAFFSLSFFIRSSTYMNSAVPPTTPTVEPGGGAP